MNKKNKTEEKDSIINPIDKDKITETPHILPYAHTVGSALIKPIDKGRVKGLAVSAMYEQTDMQLDQIREQVELLVQQAEAIQDRVRFSEAVYKADAGFKPIINHIYHLYKKKDGKDVLSMIAPNEWGKNMPYIFQASLKMLSDHTWEVLEKGG